MGNTFGKHDLESGDLIYRANERLNYRDHSHLGLSKELGEQLRLIPYRGLGSAAMK